MKRKPPALRNIGIDLNRRAIDTFRCEYPVELHHGCAHRFLSEFDFDGRELVYSDPPYVQSARKSQRRYRFDYTDADHVALLGILRSLPCQVMVSGYPSRLYDERLADWRSLEIQVNNQSCVVTEKLWFNFAPDRVHCNGIRIELPFRGNLSAARKALTRCDFCVPGDALQQGP